ncbi:MAG: DUF2953 domain-containing protein [Christensenellales bacterium]
MAIVWTLLCILLFIGLLYIAIYKVRIILSIQADEKQADIGIVFLFLCRLIPMKLALQFKRQKDGLTLFFIWKHKKRRLGTVTQLIKNRQKENPFVAKVIKELYFIQLRASLQIGTPDAAATALTIGALQTGAAMLNAFSGKNKFMVKLTPVFSGPSFKLAATCILELKKANIIFDIVKLLMKI